MQTAGSGGATDPTPNASDAIFVFVGSGGVGYDPGRRQHRERRRPGQGVQRPDRDRRHRRPVGPSPTAARPPPIAPRTGALPGTDCALPGTTCLTGTALAAVQEAFEGELWQPSGDMTVTDAYDGSAFGGDAWGTTASSSMFGEIGLAANSDRAARRPDRGRRRAGRARHRRAHGVQQGPPAGPRRRLQHHLLEHHRHRSRRPAVPVVHPDQPGPRGRVGLLRRPDDLQRQLRHPSPDPGRSRSPTTAPASGVDFTNTRPAGAADVGGDIKLATFNVLNFFPVSAAEYVALNPATNSCTPFLDRDDNPIAVNSCNPNGPRGAWDDTNLRRQRSKIVKSINAIDADVVSLEEIENSVQFGRNRDDAIEQARGCPQHRRRAAPAGPSCPRRLPPTCRRSRSRTSSATRSSTTRPRSSRSAPPRCWSATPRSTTRVSRWPRRSRSAAPATPTRSA